ncbi:MAG: methionine ABC transporter ATP-binding protein [Betaproteobacteria bacterium]
MIRLVDVTKTYRQGKGEVQALRGITLEVEQGEVFGIIGPSGAGKSTLLRCINLLERPDSGEVWVDGREVTRLDGPALRRERQAIGMVFQHFNLLSSRTVAGNVAFPLEIAGVPRSVIRPRVAELLALVGLEDKADAYPRALSGGQKQRVGIARALANHPKVLLSDEATSALDPETTKQILALLRRINRDLGLTIVLITHEMAVVREVCDRVAVLEDGRVVEEGSVVDVFARPRAALTRRFVQGVFGAQLPQEVCERRLALVHPGREGLFVRLTFIGGVAGEPVISEVVRRFDVDANILAGHIDHVGETPFGQLVVEVTGEAAQVESALAYLRERGLIVEPLREEEPAC